ncbi:MAG: glycoside hydrolase family 31 protein [Clostridia bacterium]|nr:glycoside hydrolase family 31 protein [Clostridia bacterium]
MEFKTMKLSKKSHISDVRYTSNSLFLKIDSKMNIRIRFEGMCGWRLQTSSDGKFGEKGAAQALAAFMNEKNPSRPHAITISKRNNNIVASEKNGTEVIISAENGSISFCDKNGKTVTEIKSIMYSGSNTVMTGVLDDTEAYYGGGERLDTANKRGTSFDLFTSDGWNNSFLSYTVIPLFLTTRGGGMYINRNESAWVDFGKEKPNEWFYRLRRGEMDCYFYPTGRMTDALYGYTALTGHAYMPSEWMQKMHICRYRPDFSRFEKDDCFATAESIPDFNELYICVDEKYVPVKKASEKERNEAKMFFVKTEDRFIKSYVRDDSGILYRPGPKGNPGGNSCKTIISNYISNDMKPAAASMEALLWSKCFHDTDEGRAYKAEMQQSINWLHKHGIRAMVYLRAGETDSLDIGYKDEYRVHADVSVKNDDGSITVNKNTADIPWLVGTGDNPDIGKGGYGGIRTADYLDITNPEAVNWYFDNIWGQMIEMGIDGVKIDFCECMPDGDVPAGSVTTHYKWKNPALIAPGTEHHAYPVYFISAFYRRMLELRKKKGLNDGFMLFSRGGGIGSQRNPYMWAGDQVRSFGKLQNHILAVVNSGLSGHPFMSADMAGYAYGSENYHSIGKEKESEVFARGVEFTAFFTQMQTHGDVRHAYEMTEQVRDIYRNFIRLHDDLMPYIRKYTEIACSHGIPPVRHLALDHPDDKNVYDITDEFMLGDGLLVAPILSESSKERSVYLPRGTWKNMLTGELINGEQTVRAEANLGQIPVFLNMGSRDCKTLLSVFEGAAWHEIKNFKETSKQL